MRLTGLELEASNKYINNSRFLTGMGGVVSARVHRGVPPGVRHVVDTDGGGGEAWRGDGADG